MSRTDKTRPFWVKVCDNPSNYKETHNHASRPLRDEKGNYVRVPIPGKFYGKVQATYIVMVPFTECDLPASPQDEAGHGTFDGCTWTYTAEFINSGEARCGCRVCSNDDYYKSENRKQRRAGKREAKNWKDSY